MNIPYQTQDLKLLLCENPFGVKFTAECSKETDLDVKEEQLDTVNEACVSSRMTDPVKKIRQDIHKTKAERTVTPYVKDLTKLRGWSLPFRHSCRANPSTSRKFHYSSQARQFYIQEDTSKRQLRVRRSISSALLFTICGRCNHSCKDKHQCRHLWYSSRVCHAKLPSEND